jgi:hypothetical protein
MANPGVIATSPMTPTMIAAPPIPLISRSLHVPGGHESDPTDGERGGDLELVQECSRPRSRVRPARGMEMMGGGASLQHLLMLRQHGETTYQPDPALRGIGVEAVCLLRRCGAACFSYP